jgi:hypothetical protein
MMTRATNAIKHPGQVVINSSSRRPKGVVQAERTSRAAEKERLAAVQEEGINEVAQIENNARKKKALGPHASGKRNTVTIPRAKRVRKPRAATPVDQGKLSPLKKMKNSPLVLWAAQATQMMVTPLKPSHSWRPQRGTSQTQVQNSLLSRKVSYNIPPLLGMFGLLQLSSNSRQPWRRSWRKSHRHQQWQKYWVATIADKCHSWVWVNWLGRRYEPRGWGTGNANQAKEG